MQNTKRSYYIHALVESAIMIALAFVLSSVRIYKLPQGGSVTLVSMLPIIIIGIRQGLGWGLGSGFVYAMLQLLQDGGIAPPTSDFYNYFIVFMLDYFLAFVVLGLSGLFRRHKSGVFIAVPVCLTLRFLCHFFSGIIVWSVYAENMDPVLYSLGYNGSYMGIELILTLIVTFLLYDKDSPIKKFIVPVA